jgi:MFS family permease
VLPLSIALVTAGVFMFANAGSYAVLLLSQVIVAIGSCTAFVGAGYIGGQWFGMAKFGFMFGLVAMGSALASAFALNIFEAVLGSITWRTLFNIYGAIGVVILALVPFTSAVRQSAAACDAGDRPRARLLPERDVPKIVGVRVHSWTGVTVAALKTRS